VEAFDRPSWLYRSRGRVPRAELQFRAARQVSEADVALCRRLVDAYALAEADAPVLSGIWSQEVFQDRHRDLVLTLRSRDAAVLAERLASMFRSHFVLGMALGSMGLKQSGLSARLSRLYTLNRVVALAESQGAARIENPEQGSVGLAFTDGVESLVARTEAALGVSLDFPEIGAAHGIQLAGRLIPLEAPDQIYGAARLRDAIQTYLADRQALRVVEIGGGYGAMAYWILGMIDLQYVIVDLPVANVLQGYFLAQALGASEVSFYGEAPARVAIAPTHALSTVRLPFDVLANKDSMPEIPEAAVLDYLTWARAGCNGIFYSYNQEAAAIVDGTPQTVVPDVLAEVGGFVRLRRDPSWLRRGYAEEIYRVQG